MGTLKWLHEHVTFISTNSLDLLFLSHTSLARMLTIFFIIPKSPPLVCCFAFYTVSGKNQRLVADEPVEFEK